MPHGVTKLRLKDKGRLTKNAGPDLPHSQVLVVAQSCLTLCDPIDCSRQAPLSMGFSRQEYWSELPFPSPEIFLTQGLNAGLLNCRQVLYHMSHQESPPSSKSYHYSQYHKSHYLPISEHLLFAWQRIAKDFFFKTSSFFIGVQSVNNVVVVSGEQWRDSAIQKHVSIFPQSPLPTRLIHDPEQSSMCCTVGPCW